MTIRNGNSNVQTLVSKIAHRIRQDNSKVVYVMGRIASGKGYINPILADHIGNATTITISDIVSQLVGSTNRADLQNTNSLDTKIIQVVRERIIHALDCGMHVIVDGIRQIQILMALQGTVGGSCVWISSPVQDRLKRFKMRASHKDMHVDSTTVLLDKILQRSTDADADTMFYQAENRDDLLGVGVLEKCVQYMQHEVIYNPLTEFEEINWERFSTQTVLVPEVVEQPAPVVVAPEVITPKVAEKVKVDPTPAPVVAKKRTSVKARIPAATLMQGGFIPVNDNRKVYTAKAMLMRSHSTPATIAISTNVPTRLRVGDSVVTLRAIVKGDNTSLCIIKDTDGNNVFGRGGNLGISLRAYLIGPNFLRRNADSKTHDYTTESFKSVADPVQTKTFLCFHARVAGGRPVAITYYCPSSYSVKTIVFDMNIEIDKILSICNKEGIKEIPETYATWNA